MNEQSDDNRAGANERPGHTESKALRVSVGLAALIVIVLTGSNFVLTVTNQADAQPNATSGPYNGFDVSNAVIPKSEIMRGGPPRDGIPAIIEPNFVSPAEAAFLQPGDQVLGFEHGGEARAYPLRILVWHEIVNDTVGGLPIMGTYCPLCGTAMVFEREYGGHTLTFGVSGLLYNSDVLMYDHQSESLWSQLDLKAVSGQMVGTQLEWLPAEQMTWDAWRERYPDGLVLSTETGHRRNYGRMPYKGYEATSDTIFPVPKHRSDLANKAWVVGVIMNGEAKAYPVNALKDLESQVVTDTVGDVKLRISYHEEDDFAEVQRLDTDEQVPSVRAYWFAWQAFYPDTSLYKP